MRTATLESLLLLHGKIIFYKNKLHRVAVETVKTLHTVVDRNPNVFRRLVGDQITYKEIELEDVKQVWLIAFNTERKKHLCMSPKTFIDKVILESGDKEFYQFQVTRKLGEYYRLKQEFANVYNMTPRKEYTKVPNI